LNADFFKRGLLLFWAVWFSVVLATNTCDALKALGLLGPGWRFASGNFGFVAETTARYGVATWVNAILFLGVVVWEAAAALLFWLAWGETRSHAASAARHLYPAFSVSLALWGAFLLADELLIAYAVEASHLRLFTAQLASLLAIVLLPGQERQGGPALGDQA
jgi:hypothetical protein